MQIIGMLDSPFVRRVAISAEFMGIAFEHRSISIFRQIDLFRTINPLLKVPTLVCDDGRQLLDSQLILDYLESTVASDKSLMPKNSEEHFEVLRILGIAFIACEKTVQHLYETEKRPIEKQYDVWINRVKQQIAEAWHMLELVAQKASPWLAGSKINQADITVAVAWRFSQFLQPGLTSEKNFPALAEFSARMEKLPEFIAWPVDRQ